jgi:hypothetical protein
VSLRQTLPLPKCPPHLSEAQRGRLWLSLAWARRDGGGGDGGGGGGGRGLQWSTVQLNLSRF